MVKPASKQQNLSMNNPSTTN